MLKIKLLVALSALLGLAAIASASGITFIGGKAMMPLSSIKDRFGAKIVYNNRAGIAIKLDYRTAFLRPGYRQARVDRRNFLLDGKVVVINGVTYVPATFMNDAFGYKSRWNDRKERMIFTHPRSRGRVIINVEVDCDNHGKRRNDRDCDHGKRWNDDCDMCDRHGDRYDDRRGDRWNDRDYDKYDKGGKDRRHDCD
ncbi:MAG: copper amine oxidase N-terminal domain-containing protein [Armatimonadota bacterium]